MTEPPSHPDERLLGDVLGCGRIAGQEERQAHHLGRVAKIEILQSSCVRFVRPDLGVSLPEDHGAVVHLTIETHESALGSRSGFETHATPRKTANSALDVSLTYR